MNNLSKEERLSGKKNFEDLINIGTSFFLFPFRVVVMLGKYETENKNLPALGISVSKRKFKRAVDRNRIKRLVRECYRTNKTDFYESLIQKNLGCKLLLIYTHSKILDYKTVNQKIVLILQKLDHDHIKAF